VPVDDIHAMAEAMKKALARQPEARESSRIQAYINARFSSQTMAAGYLALVESLEA
jgi:glycosyltransferase involved in cell wall biosynthesis